jgi:heterodisulfide reductase subunit C
MIDESAKSLLATIREKSGQDILACYHCQKCVVGCPVAEFMDVPPNAIHRLIQYGRKDEILKSATIWLCAACETCGTRCPNDIDIARVMDALKQIAVKEGVKGKERDVAVMHGLFMSGIRKRGRMHEVSLIRDLKLRTGGFFKDIRLGIKMFRLGKLSLSAECVKNVKDIKQMFDRAKAIE